MLTYPIAEHEACAQDIAELRWDLDNWIVERDQMKQKVKQAVLNNKLLQENIAKLTQQW